ncbi:MAG: LytR cell envelope-related transcriptional attenuator [Actinomycetia bacterium]|nr:LytR cell envelope-related transcriptional attenuator [Actinomycetes bacterium]
MTDATMLPGAATRPRRTERTKSRGFAGSMAFSALRAGGLIAVAIVIGLALLQVVDNGGGGGKGGGTVAAGTTTTTTTAAGGTTTTAPGGTTTTAKGATTTTKALKPPAEVQVVVLNASGIAGNAAAVSSKLTPLGYKALTPGNATGTTGTTVYFKPGYDGEATALAASLATPLKSAPGASPIVGAPKPIPVPAPAGWSAGTGVQNANLIVVVGAK